MMNVIALQGRLTADPEQRAAGGVSLVSFTIAVDRDQQGRNGERQTDFIDVSVWRQRADFVKAYFRKGDMIMLRGRLQSRKWQDRSGQTRTSWEVVADDVWFGGGGKRESGKQDGVAVTFTEEDGRGGDLPF